MQAVANGLAGTYTITAGAAGGEGVAFTSTNGLPPTPLINRLPPTVVGMRYHDVPGHPATLVLSFSQPMDVASTAGPGQLPPGPGRRPPRAGDRR